MRRALMLTIAIIILLSIPVVLIYASEENEIIVPIEYRELGEFSEGLVWGISYDSGKWGFINLEGEVAIPFEYDYVENFRNGLALVGKDGKHGYIDALGEVVVPLEFDEIEDFSNSRSIDKKGKNMGMLIIKGK